MCFSQKMPQDNSAAEARQQEQERQDRIRAGQGQIDAAFAQYDEPFYSTASQNYLDYYNPQLDDQYDKARRDVAFGLARSGLSESTAAADKYAELDKAKGTAAQQIAGGASDYAQGLRNKVESSKSSLYDLNTSAADPTAISSRLSAATQDLSAPTTFSPLGEVFASFLNQGANALNFAGRGYDVLGAGLGPTAPGYGGSRGGYVVS